MLEEEGNTGGRGSIRARGLLERGVITGIYFSERVCVCVCVSVFVCVCMSYVRFVCACAFACACACACVRVRVRVRVHVPVCATYYNSYEIGCSLLLHAAKIWYIIIHILLLYTYYLHML